MGLIDIFKCTVFQTYRPLKQIKYVIIDMGILDDYAFNKYVSHILRKLFFNFSTKYEVIKNRQLTVFSQ